MMIRTIFAVSLAASAMGCAASSQEPKVAAAAGCDQLASEQEASSILTNQVYASREVREPEFLARALQPVRTVGADIYVHAKPGMTGEYLERVLTCHAAQGVAVNNNDPFHPSVGHVNGVTVRSVGTGFAVRVRGNDRSAAQEIWRRAEALAPEAGSVGVEQVAAISPETSGL